MTAIIGASCADVSFPSGNYSTSCTKCSIKNLEKKSMMLTCSCQDADRDDYSKSSLELSTATPCPLAQFDTGHTDRRAQMPPSTTITAAPVASATWETKHSMVLSREVSSWFVLGALTSLDRPGPSRLEEPNA